jgi:uncharacterized membrane protein YesL
LATNTKNKLFGLFDYNRDNRPDAKEEDTTPTLKRYFKLLGRRFWKLISLNLIMLPLILPFLICLYLFVSMPQTPVAEDFLVPQLFGANAVVQSPSITMLFDILGTQKGIPVYGVGAYIGMGACFLFLFLTFGWQNVGATYIVRNMVRGDAVFIWSDYFYAIKRNLKQGFLMGLLDATAIFALCFDLVYFSGQPNTFMGNLGFYGVIALIILYFIMRFYIYLLLVTFDLSIRKIFKNALIFTTLGIKRNLMAILGLIVITAIHVLLIPLLIATPLGGIPIILPFIWYLAITTFTCAYAAYPIIDRYMIAPYVSATDDDDSEDDGAEEEPTADEIAPENT